MTGESDGLTSVPRLPAAWANQNRGALDRLVPPVYDARQSPAHNEMHGERAGHMIGGNPRMTRLRGDARVEGLMRRAGILR